MIGNSKIAFAGLTKTFSGTTVLQDIDITVRNGEVSILAGVNGTGKTTLLKILSGLLRPDSCEVDFGTGKTPWKRVRKKLLYEFMYMHQSPYMFNGTVLRNLEISVSHVRSRGLSMSMIEEALDWAELGKHRHKYAGTLSGGQQQRVALARAWLRQAPYLLLDEPTANMDSHASIRTLKLLKKLKESGTGLVICTHNTPVFRELSDRMLLLTGEGIVDSSTPEFEGNVASITGDSSRGNAVA